MEKELPLYNRSRAKDWTFDDGHCYIDCDGNNWHFHANLSSGVLLVWDGDSAYIGNVWKPGSPAVPSWLWSRVWGSSYQLLRYWWSHLSGEWATVDTCRLLWDNSGVSSRKGDSDTVLSSSSEKASRSRELWSKMKIDKHVYWCRSRLRYINGRSPL